MEEPKFNNNPNLLLVTNLPLNVTAQELADHVKRVSPQSLDVSF